MVSDLPKATMEISRLLNNTFTILKGYDALYRIQYPAQLSIIVKVKENVVMCKVSKVDSPPTISQAARASCAPKCGTDQE